LTSGPAGRVGGPGTFAARRARAAQLLSSSAAGEPLALLEVVLEHQAERAHAPEVEAAARAMASASRLNRDKGVFPLLDLDAAVDPVIAEIDLLVTALNLPGRAPVPAPLEAAGSELKRRSMQERGELVQAWLDDPSLLDPRFGFWIAAAAAPVLESAAAGVSPPERSQWSGAACPVCGGPPQVSVIAEQSGEFMAGSPRSLVCSRCATWWAFPRAVCPWCGEDDSRKLVAYTVEDLEPARLDACETCSSYVKSFDLRRPGGRDVAPQVDDVATLALDLWAQERGLHRSARSFAGV
jgi:formate dehydrogenase accessory protein FdhE